MNNADSQGSQQNAAIRLLRLLRYNKVRCERAIELMPSDKRALFHAIPFLLHVNSPEFPGYVDDPLTPHGLNNYSKRSQLEEALVSVFPEKADVLNNLKNVWPKDKKIDSLLLMGSVGTIAQSENSDFDYWVCVDAESLGSEAVKLLQAKLELIESWAWFSQRLEVHFFLSDIERVRNNDFGAADKESSGSAQALFLKAEFYSTHIVVAGKAPFWWLMSDNTSDQEYQQVIAELKNGTSPDPNWFMDLGNLARLDPGELFGAAIWQIVKAMDSPFKSVLKLAKLEVFLHNLSKEKPLCNVLRDMVQRGVKSPGGLEHVDPYALMFDEIISHYEAQEQMDIVRLLRLCFYIKCDCKLSAATASGQGSYKRKIMQSYVTQWEWNKSVISRIDRVKYWDFKEKTRLSRQIHSFLISCYRRISEKLADHKQQVAQEDMTVIGRKIEAFYAKKPDKIHYLRSVFDNELYSQTVTIKADKHVHRGRSWHLLAGEQISAPETSLTRSLLLTDPSPIKLVAWATWNGLMDRKTTILLDYNTEPVTEQDLEQLALHIHKLFPRIKVAELKREELLVPARIINCLAVINFEERRASTEVRSVVVIYSTSWGEMFVVEGVDRLKSLQFDLKDVNPKPTTCVFAPEESHKQRLYASLEDKVGIKFDVKL